MLESVLAALDVFHILQPIRSTPHLIQKEAQRAKSQREIPDKCWWRRNDRQPMPCIVAYPAAAVKFLDQVPTKQPYTAV